MKFIGGFFKPSFITCVATTVLSFAGVRATGQTLEVLHYFQGYGDGEQPLAGLAQGPDGNFYGATFTGGTYTNGAIFQVTPAGGFTLLHAFNGDDGNQPATTLVLGPNGNFYGTANFKLFSISPTGDFAPLGYGAGGVSGSGLMLGSDGNFYAANSTRVYQLTPGGGISTIFQFPFSGALQFYTTLTEGTNGTLYGIDQTGGTNGQGMVYQVMRTPADLNDTMVDLFDFAYETGAGPAAPLVLAKDGFFYGTTRRGGSTSYGTVFKMGHDGSIQTIFTFHETDGSGPSGLIQASDGNLYGTTTAGGLYHVGTVFRITTGGVLTTLASFAGTNGSNPQANLVQGSDGHFYGTASQGGIPGPDTYNGAGTVFRLVMQPAFQAPVLANGSITFSWQIMPGQTYQVQYSTNLASSQWFDLGSPVTATSTTASIQEAIGSNSGRFYRVKLIP